MSPPAFTLRSNLRQLVPPVIAWCLGVAAYPTPAQTINLNRELSPPAVAVPSLAADLVSVLEREAADLNALGASESMTALRIAIAARVDWRRVSAALLAEGDRTGDKAPLTWLAGLKLAIHREAFDREALNAASDVENPRHREALDAMERFSRGFAQHVQAGFGIAPIEGDSPREDRETELLLGLLQRLAPLAQGAGAEKRSHWVGRINMSAVADAPAEVAVLRERVPQASLTDAGRDAIVEILDFLERGRHFEELSPRIVEYHHIVDRAIASAMTFAESRWLGDAQREERRQQLEAALVAFRDPERRLNATSVIERLSVECDLLRLATHLVDANTPEDLVRDAVTGMHKTLDISTDDEAAPLVRQMNVLLERMLEVRTLPPSGLTREVRNIERDLLRAYRASEAKILAGLARGDLPTASLSDPALISLVDDHRQRAEDVARVRRIPKWVVAINQIHPQTASDFEVHTRKRALGLLEPSKVDAARQMLDRFEAERAKVEVLPFEQALVDATPIAVQLTGGLHAQLLTTLSAMRQTWAEAWSRADVEFAPAANLLLMRRLMQSLHDASSLLLMRAETLNRWPAWQASSSEIDSAHSDVITRLRLACAAMCAQDLEAVEQQVDRIDNDAAMVKLAGRLGHLLGNELRERDDGVAGVLAQLTIAPSEHAIMVEQSAELALLCRYAAEAEHARASGHASVAIECRAYVNALAARLLLDLEGETLSDASSGSER